VASRVPLIALIVVASSAAGSALAAAQTKQYHTYTAEQFIAAMKTVGQAFAAVTASLDRREFEDSKAYLAISRDRLATTISFWRDRKKDEAIKLLRGALARLDDLDAALSAEKVDPGVVAAAARQVGISCEACHALYREQDPASKAYRFKPGVIE
jgi:hypothetical protein